MAPSPHRRVAVLSAQLASSAGLEPDTAAFCALLNEKPAPDPREVEVATMRKDFLALLKAVGHPGAAACSLAADMDVPSPARAVPVRYYRPLGVASDAALPLCMYMHGGGWAQGSVEAYDGFCRALCNSGKFAVVSVEYRLAPEHPMPAASDDCFAVLRWLAAGNLPGTRADRIAVAGDSAGGHLAAVMAHLACKSGIPLRLQALLCPVTDARMGRESYELFAEGHLLTTPRMEWFNKSYSGEDPASWLASPLLAPDDQFRGLAPALVVTASHDILRDEGAAYAGRLRSLSRGPVEHKLYGGQVHDFFLFPGAIQGAVPAVAEIAAAVARALEDGDRAQDRSVL